MSSTSRHILRLRRGAARLGSLVGKGTPNKIKGMVKAQILDALEKEGGVDWLRGLARENNPLSRSS